MPGLQIIPARASYRHARLLAEESAGDRWGGLEQLVEAHLRRLDNAHWDALLALKDDRATSSSPPSGNDRSSPPSTPQPVQSRA